MRTSKIQPRLPVDLKAAAMREAEAAGVGMTLFIATTLAACGARTTPARALLNRLGGDEILRDGDEIEIAPAP